MGRNTLEAMLVWLLPFALALPTQDATHLEFTDIDTRSGYIAGIALITRASNESSIDFYALYFSSNSSSTFAQKLILDLGYPHSAIVDNIKKPTLTNPAHPAGQIRVLIPPTIVPSGALSVIVISKSLSGEKSTTNCTLPLVDVTSASLPLCKNTTLTHPSGALDDGSGDVNYTSAVESPKGSYQCIWNITNQTVKKFLFRVTYLQLDPFDYDSLCVYDGNAAPSASNKIECYKQSTGAARSYNVVSNSNTIQVVLNVTGSISGAGFRAVYFGLLPDEFQNTQDESVLKIQYDQHEPANCHCVDIACQGEPSNCFVDEGNGKGWATCNNLDTCND